MGVNPEFFFAFTYALDTLALIDQARIISFNPKVFYTGFGTCLPLYRAKFA